MFSQYNDGEMTNALGRDIYVPGVTPTGNGDSTNNFQMHAKSSRFGLKAVTTLDDGEKITSVIELDFLGSAQGNENVSNSYSPRLRHAFFTYKNLTVGQTWSTFMNVSALPETVDFVGVMDGTVFARQPQVRYTTGNLEVALENPASTVGGTDTNDNSMPDVVARYSIKSGNSTFTVAGIVREIKADNPAIAAVMDNSATPQFEGKAATAAIDDSEIGYGINLAGVIKLGADDLKFSVSHGQLGRYIGFAPAADALAVAGTDNIEATDVTSAFVAYRHFWNPKLRSTIAYSMLEADYGIANSGRTENVSSARVNLMYSPTKEVTYGVEYSNAQRELDDAAGTDGSMDRVQFSAQYKF